MENSFLARIKRGWNAFKSDESSNHRIVDYGRSSYYRPDITRLSHGNERSFLTSVFTRIALDISAVTFKHVKLDEDDRFREEVKDLLNSCLSLEANIDQSSRYFMQDAVLTMLDEGVVALVPVSTVNKPDGDKPLEIISMRVGHIIQWYPNDIRVRMYDELDGTMKEIEVPKYRTPIIQNPFYTIMNEPSSVMQRLIRKLNLLDVIDEQSGSGKLDLIIQLPYVVRGERKKDEAKQRLTEIENQLNNTKYGIAYTDGAEKITQLNRAVENNLMNQIDYLTKMFYSQLGISQELLNGTANEDENIRYQSRILEPILEEFRLEMTRKFLTKTARTQGHAVKYFKDPFKLISVFNIAEIADKMTRNEIMSSNEFRTIVGLKPSDDPNADELRNKNLNQSNADLAGQLPMDSEEGAMVSDLQSLNEIDMSLDELEDSLAHYASKYYDPEYMSEYNHAYYEAHKKLKGNRSTTGLNEEGRERARVAKEKIWKDRDSKLETINSNYQNQNEQISKNLSDRNQAISDQQSKSIEALKGQRDYEIEGHKTVMNQRIEDLRNRLSKMSSKDKQINKDTIQKMIDNLRTQNANKKAEILSKYGIDVDTIKTSSTAKKETNKSEANTNKETNKKETNTKKQETKDWANDEYEKVLDDLKKDPSLQKSSTSKTSSSKSVLSVNEKKRRGIK